MSLKLFQFVPWQKSVAYTIVDCKLATCSSAVNNEHVLRVGYYESEAVCSGGHLKGEKLHCECI